MPRSKTYQGIDEILNDSKPTSYKVSGAKKEELKKLNDEGLPLGRSTHIPELDENWRWYPGMNYLITGWPGAGKGELLATMMALRAEKDGTKFGVYSPESYPMEIYQATIGKAYLGVNIIHGYGKKADETQLKATIKFLDSHFRFLEFEDIPRLPVLLDIFRELVIEGFTMFVVDPYNAVAEGVGQEGTQGVRYLKQCLTQAKMFSIENNANIIFVEHPKTPIVDKDGKRPLPSPFMVFGGTMWWNKIDGLISVDRDVFENGNEVTVRVWKQKTHAIMGTPGEVLLNYDIRTGSYKGLDNPLNKQMEITSDNGENSYSPF